LLSHTHMFAIQLWQEMCGWWTFSKPFLQVGAAIGAVSWTSQHQISKIRDYGHEILPFIRSEIAHLTCVGLCIWAAITKPWELWHCAVYIYAPCMFIKATLITFTILPDANPECHTLDPLKCATRNDMLPSGHMLVALSSALALNTDTAYALASVCGLMLIASKMHYTVDVILSCWLVYLHTKIRY